MGAPIFRSFANVEGKTGQLDLRRQLPVLSMGMSHDFEVAIQEGSTEVRVGTAIFGTRPAPDASNESRSSSGAHLVKLFHPFRLRQLEFKNRIAVSSMCEYSAVDGHPNTWHLVHLGSRAVGGAALVMAEASGVSDIGRISPGDTGLYLDSHVDCVAARLSNFVKEHGAIAGIQLAHAGRKASTDAPWRGGKPLSPSDGAWTPVGKPACLSMSATPCRRN